MSSSTLTAKKNVRDKLKRIHEIIDRADELQYQKVSHSVARNFSNDNDDDDGDNDNKSNANNNLTKLLSQPIKMKDGTIGTPVFVLATCAVEGLDSYTVRDVFERLMRYGAWRVGLDEHGTYPRVAKTISPVVLLCSVYAPHILKHPVSNIEEYKDDGVNSNPVVAVRTAKEEYDEVAEVHRNTLQNLNKVLEMFVDAGANVDETYQIDPSIQNIVRAPSLSSTDDGQQYGSYKFPSCAMHSGTIGNCLFFLSIAISFGSDIEETIEALHIITQRGSNKRCDLNIKCYIPDRRFDFKYDETTSFQTLEHYRVCPRTPAGDYISFVKDMLSNNRLMSLGTNRYD